MRLIVAFLAALLLTSAAFAQTPSALRGTIESLSADGSVINARTRAGEPATIRLKPDVRVIAVVAASLQDLSEGAYVGVAAVPDGDDGLRALEVHIFPEAMRGAGEGHRPFDLAPGSSMTNGALTARIDSADGPMLTVGYPGGTQKIRIDSATKIVAFAPGERSELVPGAAIIARGAKAADGAIEAGAVLVGRNGVVPPM
jgi:Domain of unknown function (DUF5666)